MKVIGLTGPARSGKDTVARMIAEELPAINVRREGFADKLKVSAARALGHDGTPAQCIAWCDGLKVDGDVDSWVGGPDRSHYNLCGRQFLQRYGTEAHREVFGEDFWLDAVLPMDGYRASEALRPCPTRDDCDVLVISDVRFENEAQRVRDYGGEIWKVYRPDVLPVTSHASEAGLPPDLIDVLIPNVGTLDYLREYVRAQVAA
jgi:hypothetical protein